MTLSKFALSAITSAIILTGCGGGGGGSSSSSTNDSTTTPTPTNNAPVANAGQDQSVVAETQVSLSGAASSDADGDSLTYSWAINSAPSGSAAALSNATSEVTTLTPDVAGEYQIALTVNDGTIDSSPDIVVITVSEPTTSENSVPIANAGSDQAISLGQSITLDGSQSTDADGDALSYSWQIASKPDSSALVLTNNTSANIDITPDIAGTYSFSLIVNDGQIDSVADSVLINVSEASAGNNAPISIAGNDQTVNVDESVALVGSNSSDADGDSLAFTWSISSLPLGSRAELSDASSADTSFTPDTSGEYVLTLQVDDGELTDSSQTTITVQANNLDITDKIFVKRSDTCADYVGTYQSTVEDIRRSMSFSGSVEITASASECTVVMNQIPNHDFNDNSGRFATDVSELNENYRLTVNPTFSGTERYLELGVTEGVMLNGVTLDILPAACYAVGSEPLGEEKIGCGQDQIDNPWRYDPMSPLNTFGTDAHNAHTQPTGKYHYHANPVAMFSQNCADGSPSAVIGFAADGFPIFGSCFTDPSTGEVRKATASYQLKDNGGPRQDVAGYTTPVAGEGAIASANYDGQFRGDWEYVDGTGDLDECNGMTVEGQYGYYVTDSYPWVINCFKGSVNNTFGRSEELERRTHSHGDVTHSH
ncbi:YHYH protein [Thalassotalea euphylliae]|uniref:YHYH protein n=1 Tax=Thalassotalea euphylliae TaxID=1655234 RepID=UPI0036300E71